MGMNSVPRVEVEDIVFFEEHLINYLVIANEINDGVYPWGIEQEVMNVRILVGKLYGSDLMILRRIILSWQCNGTQRRMGNLLQMLSLVKVKNRFGGIFLMTILKQENTLILNGKRKSATEQTARVVPI